MTELNGEGRSEATNLFWLPVGGGGPFQMRVGEAKAQSLAEEHPHNIFFVSDYLSLKERFEEIRYMGPKIGMTLRNEFFAIEAQLDKMEETGEYT